jgi:hypothetical protein
MKKIHFPLTELKKDLCEFFLRVTCIRINLLDHDDNAAITRPAFRLRPDFVRTKVRVHEYPDGQLAIFWGSHRLADYDACGRPIDTHALAA